MRVCRHLGTVFLDKKKELPEIVPGVVCGVVVGKGATGNGTVDFSGLCSDQQLSFFTLLDRASFPHYNNTKIIKFG